MKIYIGAVPLYHGPYSRKLSHTSDMQGAIFRGRLCIHFFVYRVFHYGCMTTTRPSYLGTIIGVIILVWWFVYILRHAPSCLLWVQILWLFFRVATQVARFTWPTWSQPGSCRTQVGPMLAPWPLLSGYRQYSGPLQSFKARTCCMNTR